MQRAAPVVLLALALAIVLSTGCSRPANAPARALKPYDDRNDHGPLPPPVAEAPRKVPPIIEKIDLPEPSPQERQTALLLQGLDLAAEHKYAAALELLERARQIHDDAETRGQIERVQSQRAEEERAERMAEELGKLLRAGKAEEAARLAGAALAQLGGSEAALVLLPVKRAADAVVTASTEASARRVALRQEGETALAALSLRGAVLAFEQALQLGEDAELHEQLDAVRARLTRYDQARAKAAALRHDPIDRDGLLKALLEAARAWDNRSLREEIDTSRLALLRCRDRLAVADFEVRGEMGAAAAGRVLAEELLAGFRGRYDPVDRQRLRTVVGELNVDVNNLALPRVRQELARRTGARFLVVGRVSALGAVVAQARLVEVRSGLVVQSAWLSAPTFAALLPRMETLARLLMMTDAQKLAYLRQEARLAAPVPLAEIDALPSPPEAEAAHNVPPHPLVTCTPQPIAPGELTLADFGRLPAAGAPPSTDRASVPGTDPRSRRLLALSLETGDNLYRRGLFADALRRYELALGLADSAVPLAVRLDQCRPRVPPPRLDSSAHGLRPRLVVFPFLTASASERAEPAIGDWAADYCAAYLGSDFEIVEPGQVAWYAAQLGIQVREVLLDPCARLCLAQALEARAFLFGTLIKADGYDASLHLMDAQTGAATGSGTLHLRDLAALRLRMPELVGQVLALPAEQAALARTCKDSVAVLAEIRRLLQVGHPAAAAAMSREALTRCPASCALQSLLEEAEKREQQSKLEGDRHGEEKRLQADAAASRERQQTLMQQIEKVPGPAESDRDVRQARWQRAAEQLRAQGQKALEQGRVIEAVQMLQAAASLHADDTFRLLAEAQAARARTLRDRAAEALARREAVEKSEGEAAERALRFEQRRGQAAALARKQREEERVHAALPPLLAQARMLLEKQQLTAAATVALAARRLSPGDAAAGRLVEQCAALRAEVEARHAQPPGAIERRLAEARTRHQQAETLRHHRHEAYQAVLKQARQALMEKKYDLAQARFRQAGKLFRTDEVLNGLQQTEELRSQEWARRENQLRHRTEAIKRSARLRFLMTEGQKALQDGHLDAARHALREAAQLEPDSVEILTALNRAEHAHAPEAAGAQPPSDPREEAFRRLVASGRQKLAAGNAEGAIADLCEALKLRPGAPEAASLLGEARLARVRSRSAAEDPTLVQRRTEYQMLLQQGREHLAATRYDEAAQALAAACRLMPDNREAFELLRQAQQGQRAQATARVRQLLDDARHRQQDRNIDEAGRLLTEAEKLLPEDAEVRKARAEWKKNARRSRAPGSREKKKQKKEQFERALRAGQAALKVRNFEDAVKALAEALKLEPEDAQAKALHAEAERLNREDQATYSAQVRRRAECDRLLARGRSALEAGHPAEAEIIFTEAQRVFPDDPQVVEALKKARAAQAPAKPDTAADAAKAAAILKAPQPVTDVEVPANAPARYVSAMHIGAERAKAQKYVEAIESYKEALRLLPGDPRATAALKSARAALHAAEGRKHQEAGRFAEAITEYEAALQLAPEDRDCKARLERARAGKP